MRGTITKHASQNFCEVEMKVAKKGKGVVYLNKDDARAEIKSSGKKDNLIEWFMRNAENHARLTQSIRALKEHSMYITSCLSLLKADGLADEKVLNEVVERFSKLIPFIEHYDKIIDRRRHEKFLEEINARKAEKKESKDVGH